MAEYIFDKFTDGTDTYKIDYSRIPYGKIDTGSTSTVFKATVDGITELSNGVCAVIRNNVVTSASGCTLNVNNLGAKPIYSSMAEATRITTTFNKNYTALFIYNTIRVSTGCWDMYYGYYTNSTYSNASLGQGIGTCSTAEATTTKAVTLSNYALTTGGVVVVSFTNAVPAGSSLNVNSKGSKPIYYRGSAITDGVIKAGDRATFIYSGSYYHLLTVDRSAKTATTDVDGLMSSADKTKLDGITSGAQPNQNAFSTVKVSNTDVQANSTTDTLELEAGTNISLTPDTTNKKITIASTVVNTDSKVSTANVINNTTYYPVVGSDTTNAESKYYDNNGFKYTGTQGTASAVGSAKLELGNSTSSGTANNKEGQLVLYGSKSYATTLKAGDTYGARTITFPDNSGTVALAEDYLETEWIPFDDMFIDPVYNGIVREGAVATFVQRSLNYVTPQMFGAVADGVEDDTYAIQRALDYSLNVFFPEGTYIVSAPLVIRNHTHINGMGSSSLIRVSNTSKKDSNDSYFPISFNNSNIEHDNSDLTYYIQNYAGAGKFVFNVIDGVVSKALEITDSNHSNFCIEHIKIDCNDLNYCGGIRLMCPYNDCSVRDVLIDNCAYRGIYVGDETSLTDAYDFVHNYTDHDLKPNTDGTWTSYDESGFIKAVRSQTLVIDNCYVGGSTITKQDGALLYCYNSLELNLKDTKFLFKSSNTFNQPCILLNRCTDAYIRGNSFAHTVGEAVRITGYTKYFRIIANTYENLGSASDQIKDAYVRSGSTNFSANWLSLSSGGAALEPSTSNIYKIKTTATNNGQTFEADETYRWDTSSSTYKTITVRDYAICCTGENDTNRRIQGGLIMETMYQNVPKKIYLHKTSDIAIIGSFSSIVGADTPDHQGDFLLNTLKGSILSDYFIVGTNGQLAMATNGAAFTLKDDNGVQYYLKAESSDNRIHVRTYGTPATHAVVASTADVNALKPTTKTYSIATTANSNAAPYGAVNSSDYSIASDVTSYGTPCSIVTTAPTASNCATACLIGTNKLRVYSRTAATITVRVTYWKSTQITSV